ncbi:diaminopimelate epimerase [Candidatus Woesearchaeota archaeon]|nr:diaminopimelate epimerase [Candidatus Woesearchaeota archaeon]
MKFTKMQGTGNDFILIDAISNDYSYESLKDHINKMCNRNFGIGADGVIFVLKPKSNEADFRMRIFNPDGSEAEMCGNGIRCFAKYVFNKGLAADKNKELVVETLAGLIKPKMIEKGDIIVDMGVPILESEKIPVKAESEKVIDMSHMGTKITCVSMGNPHCVVFVDEIMDRHVFEIGPKLERDRIFPKRTNVEFVRIINEENIQMRVWERGVGETLACGTGTVASVVAAILNHKTRNKVLVQLKGGDLRVEWSGEGKPAYLIGPAEFIFEGVISVK